MLDKLLCRTDFVGAGSANRTLAFESGLTIFHGNFFCILNFPFGSTFYAVHLCHFVSPPLFCKHPG